MSKLSLDRTPPTALDQPQPHAVPGAGSIRIAALGGMVFFALLVAFGSLTSNYPAATASRQKVFGYLADHQGQLQAAAVLYALAMPAALLLLSGLFRALRRAEGGTSGLTVAALAGGVLTAASTVIGALVLGTTATRYVDLGPAGARVFSTMFLLSIGATLTGLILLIGATAAVCLQTDLFARWFVITSVVLAVASVVGACTIGYPATGTQAVAGITVLLDSVWILLISVFLWRRPEVASS